VGRKSECQTDPLLFQARPVLAIDTEPFTFTVYKMVRTLAVNVKASFDSHGTLVLGKDRNKSVT